MQRLVGRLVARLAAGLAAAAAVLALAGAPASAHVVPTSTMQLAVTTADIVATVEIPLSDLEAASGIDLGAKTQSDVDAQDDAIETYLLAHFTPTEDDGGTWTVEEGDLTVADAGNAATTGIYTALQTTFTLTPPAGVDLDTASFDLGYNAIVDKVATHTTIVTVASDSTDDDFNGAYEVGTVQRDTVTNTVQELHVDLGSGDGGSAAFRDMVELGISHIRAGTDHLLFLLTLLLPAPLLASVRNGRRRWTGVVGGRRAWRRITAITLCFTLGHSLTLALGALGVPVATQLVEAAIALSILVAAVHAVRPVFPGRESLVAAGFGLVHGLAFSETLRDLDLSGAHLVLALLGFNLGIELMQLTVVALVLPPLVVLARTRAYSAFRTVAAVLTGVAASAWLAARLGATNPVADLADRLGSIGAPVVLLLWVVAVAVTVWRRPALPPPSERFDPDLRSSSGATEPSPVTVGT